MLSYMNPCWCSVERGILSSPWLVSTGMWPLLCGVLRHCSGTCPEVNGPSHLSAVLKSWNIFAVTPKPLLACWSSRTLYLGLCGHICGTWRSGIYLDLPSWGPPCGKVVYCFWAELAVKSNNGLLTEAWVFCWYTTGGVVHYLWCAYIYLISSELAPKSSCHMFF